MRPTRAQSLPAESILPSILDGTLSEKPKKKKKGKKKKSEVRIGTSRGIETMFRTSYMTHVNLSALADSKANIMISINGIIMSIIIASIAPKIDSNPWLLLPTSVLLVSCLVSIVYGVLAARPRVAKEQSNRGKGGSNESPPAIPKSRFRRDASILFFGHFTTLSEGEFVEDMLGLLENLDDLYESMIRDIYNLGQVLSRKFALLRVSYTVFMFGLAISVVLFILAFSGVAFTSAAMTANPVP